MHFMGQQVISRPTRGSGRNLVSLSFVVWFVKFYGAPIKNLVISGVELVDPSQDYDPVLWVGMLLLLVHHVMNWYGDVVSYKGWNIISDKVTSTAGFGSDTGLVSRLDSVLQIVKEKIGNKSEQDIIPVRLDEIKNGIVRLNSFAFWYIVIWLGVPVAGCFIALFWNPIALFLNL